MAISDRVQHLVTRAFRRREDARTRDVVAVLREVSLFAGLPRGALRDLAEAVHVRTYGREEVLYYERDPGLGLYVVQRGRVRLLVEDDQGVAQELRQLGEHEAFGLYSVLGDFRRMETAQALTETRVLGFFRPDLKTVVKRHPATGAAVAEALARQFAAAQVSLLDRLATRDGKLATRRLLEGL